MPTRPWAGDPSVITDVPGIRVGHWTHEVARTGCTVVLFPAGTVASGEVRGGAPATRETELLAPERLVDRIDAVLLTGGSAFGLSAADGVVRWCEQRGLGFPTAAGPVPIVPTLGLYDLAVGDPSVRPGPDAGEAACIAATDGPVPLGPVGAGTGATTGGWRGPEHVRPGGIGSASCWQGDLVVSALIAVNAFGDIDPDGSGAAAVARHLGAGAAVPPAFGHTTIGVIATNGRIDKLGCLLVAQSGHDGLGRSIAPAHTRADGDALVAAATGLVDADLEVVRGLAVAAVEAAVRSCA
ncbi:MAG: peptidase DmpA [Acidimicrobiales bacterium]|nr:peptidase DmpA [Acidimicrobiales bacterium]